MADIAVRSRIVLVAVAVHHIARGVCFTKLARTERPDQLAPVEDWLNPPLALGGAVATVTTVVSLGASAIV